MSQKAKQEQYFERQGTFSANCAVHTINNLLGGSVVKAQTLNTICSGLSDSFFNPHKHLLGGDYDANVIAVYISQIGLELIFHDERQQFSIAENIDKNDLVGLIINIQTGKSAFHKLFSFSGRHWLAVKKAGEAYYWIDSKQQNITNLSESELTEKLKNIKSRKQIIFVKRNKEEI